MKGSIFFGACVRNKPRLLTITDGPYRCTAADSEQLMPRGWFATRGIVGEVGRRQLGPRFFNRRNDAPLRLYFVSARKQRCIATHRVEQQCFICTRPLRAKARLIRE